MANRPRALKRVYGIRRAPDGSAFQNCENCGVLVAVALVDMHECEESKKDVKRFRGISERLVNVANQSFLDQPRSPFCFFMESFMKTRGRGKFSDIDREGYEVWKNMSEEERQPYINQAQKLDLAHWKTLFEEANCMQRVDEEADSAKGTKYQFYESYEDRDFSRPAWGSSMESSGPNLFTFGYLDTYERCNNGSTRNPVEE